MQDLHVTKKTTKIQLLRQYVFSVTLNLEFGTLNEELNKKLEDSLVNTER